VKAIRFLLAAIACSAAPVRAADVVLVPDVAIQLPGIAAPVDDRSAVRDRLGPSTGYEFAGTAPGVPDGVAIAALDHDPQRRPFLAFDGWIDLPGTGVVGPAHIVRLTASGDYVVEFSGLESGVPDGAAIDALFVPFEGFIVASFDVTVDAGPCTVDDEDFVAIDDGEMQFCYDWASDAAPGLDVDGLSLPPDDSMSITMSFDGSGVLGGVAFDDEDILGRLDGGTGWVLLYDASATDPAWEGADLAAFALLPGPIFADGFEAGDTSAWSAS
jgi:hypothetical protein